MKPGFLRACAAAGAALLVLCAAPSKAGAHCVPAAAWAAPGGARLDASSVIADAARQRVVLLGEMHEKADHHRWQLQMLAALHAQRPDMVIGFEMFPRRVQRALDRWVAGELSEKAFLEASDWAEVWQMDPALYLPLFHFARMNRIPMVALNIEPATRRAVAKAGFDGVPDAGREGVTRPAAPNEAYVDYLLPIYREHAHGGKAATPAGRDDAGFRRFVASQALWDRAMAQALHAAASREGNPLVVGIMGRGHLVHGYGVPHQLKDLGVTEFVNLQPWDAGPSCKELVAGIADAVFGVAPLPASPQPRRQLLGIRIETNAKGVRIVAVQEKSIAERAGIRTGDVIVEIAGLPAKRNEDVILAVHRHAPGTWLPLTVQRDGARREIVAKFPALAP